MSAFQRAKSDENKKIRFKEIMNITRKQFKEKSYHEISLTTIAKELNMARSGLYKYVETKEEIFLEIYLENQAIVINEINQLLYNQNITIDTISKAIANSFYHHLEYIQYHQILNAIIETNVSIEKLADFKLRSNQMCEPLYLKIASLCNGTLEDAFDIYLTIVYHSVYLYDRILNRDTYLKAMALANLKVNQIDFVSQLEDFCRMILQYKR